MEQQDREFFEDGHLTDRKRNQENLDAQEPYAIISRQQDQEIINPPEPVMRGTTAGSASSSRKILVRIKKLPESPEKEVAPPPQAAEVAADLPAEEKKTHYCKECDKTFSSGKALGGHMSSAHVQASKDYSLKKLKSKTKMARAQFSSSDPGPGPAENACAICGKSFPSQKSLYGHMRCHPDREWRGMEPPSEPRVEPETSTGPGLNHTMGPDQEGGKYGGMDSRPDGDGEAQAVNFANSLRGWPVKDRRGRPARPVSALASKNREFSSSDEEEAVWSGHKLLRLIKQNLDSSGKETSGEIDQGTFGKGSSGNGIGFKNHALACNGHGSDDMVYFKNDKRHHGSSVEKEVGCGSEANHGPRQSVLNLEKTHDSKRQKTNPSVPKLKIWNTNGKEKVKMGDNKTDTESENDLLLAAISVLANGKRENHHNQRHGTLDFQKPISEACPKTMPMVKQKSSLGHSSPDKYACSLCQKVFPSPQALGGHKSSHNKFKMQIVNTAHHLLQDQNNNGDEEEEEKDQNKERNNGDEEEEVGQLKGDGNKDEEKVERRFDLNTIPDDGDEEDSSV